MWLEAFFLQTMTEKKALEQTADALLGTGITITVDTPAQTLKEKALKLCGRWKEKRTFVVKPLVLGSLVRVSKLLLSIDNSLLTRELIDRDNRFDLYNLNYQMMAQHAEAMARVIAIAVINEKKEPPESLVEFFLYRLTPKELLQVFTVVLNQIDVSGFTSSIISARGLSVLESQDASAKNAAMNPAIQGS